MSRPRTFFNRSQVSHTSFRGSDLTESFLCWNDFLAVDFSGAALARADLRGSLFKEVSFAEADLSEADLRRSGFVGCDFSRAILLNARLTESGARELRLSKEQRNAISWQDDDGPEPPGG
jgi:uncharacterized protein YjbI with pentapeptide repeats